MSLAQTLLEVVRAADGPISQPDAGRLAGVLQGDRARTFRKLRVQGLIHLAAEVPSPRKSGHPMRMWVITPKGRAQDMVRGSACVTARHFGATLPRVSSVFELGAAL